MNTIEQEYWNLHTKLFPIAEKLYNKIPITQYERKEGKALLNQIDALAINIEKKRRDFLYRDALRCYKCSPLWEALYLPGKERK